MPDAHPDTLLYRVITAHRCRSTHHHITIGAANLLTGPDAGGWRDLMLVLNEDLLEGAKAPDKKFKDFKNHVLHVGDDYWGGRAGKGRDPMVCPGWSRR